MTTLDKYVSDLRKLPRRTHEQLRELKQFAIDGDSKAEQHLWEEALRIVLFTASRLTYAHRMIPDPDMIQEGNLAAGRAVRTWDPDRARFSTWIYRAARGAMIDYWNKERTQGTGGKDAPTPRMIALDSDAGVVDDYEASDDPGTAEPEHGTLMDVFDASGAYDSPESHAAREEVKRLMQSLPDAAMRETVEDYYGLDGKKAMTIREIAKARVVSSSTVHAQITKAHKLLAEHDRK